MTTLSPEARTGLAWAERAGLIAYGLLHLLLAWVSFELARGHQHTDPSGQGALRELANRPLGRSLVWTIAIALLAFACQRAVEGWLDHRDDTEDHRWPRRLGTWAKALVYLTVGFSALRIALDAGHGAHGNGERSLSARLLEVPGGGLLMILIGAVVVAVGVRQARRGLTKDFRDQLSAEGRRGESGRAYLLCGQIGHTAKGVVIGLAGVLIGYAGVTHDPRRTGGIDDALRTVRDQPFGPVLLIAVSAGLGCFGLFAFARARHLAP